MAQCTTTSGPHRCSHQVDAQGKHAGPCEAQAAEYIKGGAFATKHGYWFATCATCKRVTEHKQAIGGACVECYKAES